MNLPSHYFRLHNALTRSPLQLFHRCRLSVQHDTYKAHHLGTNILTYPAIYPSYLQQGAIVSLFKAVEIPPTSPSTLYRNFNNVALHSPSEE